MTHPRLHRLAFHLAAACAAIAVAGCAALGGGGGGGENLPNRGIVPWVPLPIPDGTGEMTPFALAPGEDEQLREPFAYSESAASPVDVYYERVRADGTSVIERARTEDGLHFAAPELILDPANAPSWVADRVGGPSVARLDSTWLLAFAYGEGAGVGLAWSFDGVHFEVDSEPLVARSGSGESGGIRSPSLLVTDEGFELYYSATTGGDSPTTSVMRATAGGDLAFERAGVALGPGVGCTEPDGQPEDCWDADGVASPEVRLAYTPAGRSVRRLFYTGDGPDKEQLGFAASYDGEFWTRFAFNPVLATGARSLEPTTLDRGDHYLLYFVDYRSSAVQGIGVAINDTGHSSERY